MENKSALKNEIRSKSNEIVSLVEKLKDIDYEVAESTALYVSESLFPPKYIPKR